MGHGTSFSLYFLFCRFTVADARALLFTSRIPTDTPGRIHKSAAIAAVEATGEGSYDTAREILKSIKLDATGKVELDDWIEVSRSLLLSLSPRG